MEFVQNVPWWVGVIVATIVLLVALYFWKWLLAFADGVGAYGYYVVTMLGSAILLGVGMLMPTFWQVVALPLPDKLKGGFGILAIIASVLVVVNVVLTQGAGRKAHLQMNVVVSVLAAIIFSIASGTMYGAGNLPFLMIVPTVYAIVLAMVLAVVGIHNAWQKNPMQAERT